MTTHQDQANAIKKADQMLSLVDLPTYTELHYGKMALEAEVMNLSRRTNLPSDLKSSEDTLAEQIRETVAQENIGITVRMATLACTCGKRRAIVLMYKCLYCGVWFCTQCAEDHFGKTIEQYKKDRAA